MTKTVYIVNAVMNWEFGWELHQKAFDNYIDAENYANEMTEKAEAEFGTSIDREQNMYAVVTNNRQGFDGFVEITSIGVDID